MSARSLRRTCSLLAVLTFSVLFAPFVGIKAADAAPQPIEWEFMRAMNARRAAAGLGALEMSPGLADIAEEWTQVMVAGGKLSHRGDLANQVARRVTSSWTVLGENVGVGYDVASLDLAFYDSPGHRANLLEPRHRYVGVGAIRTGDGRLWVTFNFMAASGAVPVMSDPAQQDLGPAVVYTDDAVKNLFRRDPQGAVWVKRGSHEWESLGGLATAAPDASTMGGDRLDVVIRGADGALWHRMYDKGAWSSWQSLGGQILGGATSVSWGAGRLDVFAIGADRALWHRAYEGGRWWPWESLGGRLASAPDASSWAPGRLDIVVRGGDDAVWHLAWDKGRWSGWSSLGGKVSAGPATGGLNGRLDVAARGTDGKVYVRSWSGSAWSNWYTLDGFVVGDVDVAVSPAAGLSVAGTGGDQQLWWRTRNSSGAWGAWALAA